VTDQIDGAVGTMSVASRGREGPGEVSLRLPGGGSQTYIAYSTEPIPMGARVAVFDTRPGRCVDVEPIDA